MYTPVTFGSIDEAIIKDRVVKRLRATWGSVSAQEIADTVEGGPVHVNVVYRIGRMLGVWRKGEAPEETDKTDIRR